MSKTTLLILVSLFSFNSLADADINKSALKVLLKNISSVQLYEGDGDNYDGNNPRWSQSLLTVVASQILGNNLLDGEVGDGVVVSSSNMTCDEGDGALGKFYRTCTLVFTGGDYTVTRDGFNGPETESALVIEFTVKTINATGETSIDRNQAFVYLAG